MSLLSLPKLPRKRACARHSWRGGMTPADAHALRQWIRLGLADGSLAAAQVAATLRDESTAARWATQVAQSRIPRVVNARLPQRSEAPSCSNLKVALTGLLTTGYVAAQEIPALIADPIAAAKRIESVLQEAEQRVRDHFGKWATRAAPLVVCGFYATSEGLGLAVSLREEAPFVLLHDAVLAGRLAYALSPLTAASRFGIATPSSEILGWHIAEMTDDVEIEVAGGMSLDQAIHEVAEAHDCDPGYLSEAVDTARELAAPPAHGTLTEAHARLLDDLAQIAERHSAFPRPQWLSCDDDVLSTIPAVHLHASTYDEAVERLDEDYGNVGDLWAVVGPATPPALGWIEGTYASVMAFNASFRRFAHVA